MLGEKHMSHGYCLLGSAGHAPSGPGTRAEPGYLSVITPASFTLQRHRGVEGAVRRGLNPGSATLDQLLKLPVPQFLHLSNGDNNPVFKRLF